MAWWPFGKKKGSPGEEGGPPDNPEAAERTMAVPSPAGADAPAPTIFVPPEFAHPGEEMPTVAAPPPAPGADPFAQGDPFAPAPAPGFDPFQAPAQPDFSKTLEDPDSPKKKRGGAPAAADDPFAAPEPGSQDFSATLGDPDEADRTIPPTYALGGGVDPDRTIPPTYALGNDQATLAPAHAAGPRGTKPMPGAPRGQAAPQQPPADLFASAEPHEKTLKMPTPPGRTPAARAMPDDGLTFTAPPPPPAPTPAPAPMAPQPAAEETPMLAKAAALSPEKIRLGRALLAGGPITQEKLLSELEKSGKSQSVLGKALVKSNFPKEEELLAALVAQIRIPKINVRNTKIPLETIRIVPGDVARKWKVLPIEKIGEILVIVSPGVGDEEALGAVRKATGCSVFPFQCDAEGFDEVLDGYYDRLASSGMASAAPEAAAAAPAAAAPGPAPRPAVAAGAMAAIPAEDDEWGRIYAAVGPLPAEEVLL